MPYGVNNSGPTSGVLLGLLSAPAPKIIKLDTKRNVALFSDDIEVPLSPFLGIMSVAPSRDVPLVSSRPPWRSGGNIDFNKLVARASLYLPVFNTGAQFYTGDPHAVQADGEVNGTAIEASFDCNLAIHCSQGRREGHELAAAARRSAHALSLVRGALPTRGNSRNPSPSFCSPLIGPLNFSFAASSTRLIPKP